MSSINEYKRYFIILQEDDKGYEMAAGKIPTGYVKVEVKHGKGKLTAFVQNVKGEDKTEYHLILVAPAKKMAVDVGKLVVDSGGRGELYYEFESDNVLKSSLGISDFSVAAVTSGVSIPLSGYTGRDKVEWKGKYEVVNRSKAAEPGRMDKAKGPVEEIAPQKAVTPPPAMGMPMAPMEMPMMPAVQPVIPKKAQPVVEVKPVMPKKAQPVVEVKPVMPKKAEPVVEIKPVPMPIVEVIPEPVPMPVVEEKPEPMPIPVVEETTVVVEMSVEVPVEIQQPVTFCPPMAPMEEPCEVEPKKPCSVEADYYYYEEEDCSSDDSDDSDDRPKKHKEKAKKEKAKEKEEKDEEYPESLYDQGDMQRKLAKVLRKLRRYEPFDDEKRDRDWYKIGDDIYLVNSMAIPFMGYMVPMGYPFMMEECVYMMGRKDYILGVKYDRHKREDDQEDEYRDKDDRKKVTHLMFGIPAVHNKRNEMYYKSKGFMHYKPHKSNSYGYFIMVLDLSTGMPARMD